jgi:hypothetical protein
MGERAKWTVLTYIAAHNNLALLGKRSLIDIMNVGSTRDVVHGALYDRHDGAGRYVMGDPGTVREQEQFANFNSGDPDALIATARWLFSKYPADRYGLVLWSHGTGWEPSEIARVASEARAGDPDEGEARERAGAPGALVLFRTTLRQLQKPPERTERAILFDDGTGQSLDTLELARVAGEIAAAVGQPIELIGMDACLMASAEIAYELRGPARFVVASSELVPGHSWPYSRIYTDLKTTPDQGGHDLARQVVNRYVEFYTETPPAAGDVTKVALDLSRLDALQQRVSALADTLRADIGVNAGALWDAQRGALKRETGNETRKPSKFDYHLWDLGSVASGLAGGDKASASVRQAAAATEDALRAGAGPVIAEAHRGAWFDDTAGVSVYLMPPGQQRISPAYADLAFAKATRWGDMLASYHEQILQGT